MSYPRAARHVDMLEDKGTVGPQEGCGSSREVLHEEDEEDEM